METNDKYERLYENQLKFLADLHEQSKKDYKKIYEDSQNALKRVKETESDVRSHFKKMSTIMIAGISLIGSVLGILGFKSIVDVKDKYDQFIQYTENSKKLYDEIKDITNESKEKFLELKENSEHAKILKEVYLEIRRSASDASIEGDIDTLDLVALGDASIRFRNAMIEIKSYLRDAEGLNYLILHEAIKNYINLVEKGEISLNDNAILKLIKTSILVIKNCDSKDWRTQLECRNLIVDFSLLLYKSSPELFQDLNNFLSVKIAGSDNLSLCKWNLVIIKSKIGSIDSSEIQYLEEFIKRINSFESRMDADSRTWLTCLSAIELVKNEQYSGWNIFSEYLKSGTFKQKSIVILVLSYLGRQKLEQFGINEHLSVGGNVDKFDFFISLLDQMEQKAEDKYSKKYYSRLINQLNFE